MTGARFGPAAMSVQRLAVLLDAGLAPLSAWRAVAAGTGSPELLRTVVGHARTAHELSAAMRESLGSAAPAERTAWAAVGAAWTVAVEAGAPLAPALQRWAEVLRGLAQASRDVEVALAGPTATARIVVALPLVGILFGVAMGFDIAGTLFTTAPGLACLAVGLALLAVAALWTRRMVRVARAIDPAPGLALELTAIAVAGGLGVDGARALVARALAEVGLDDDREGVDAVLDFSRSAGVPAGSLLRAEADESRRAAASAAQRRAAALGVRMMLPLGVCLLPSFLALGVVPIVIALVSSTAASL